MISSNIGERVSDLACGSIIEREKGDERLKRENEGRYFRKIKNKEYYFIYPTLQQWILYLGRYYS